MEKIADFVKNRVYHRLVESGDYTIIDECEREWHCSYNGLFNRYELTPRGFIIRFTIVSDEYEINKISKERKNFESIVNIYAIEFYKKELEVVGKIYLENTSQQNPKIQIVSAELFDIEFDDDSLNFREKAINDFEFDIIGFSDEDLPQSKLYIDNGVLILDYCGYCISLQHNERINNNCIKRQSFVFKSK